MAILVNFVKFLEALMFWNRFIEICKEQGTTPTAVVKALKISGGSVTKWKNGSIPTDTTILKLADYLNVSADYLSGKSNDKNKPTVGDDDELEEYLEELKNRPEMKMLFSLAKGATKQDVEQAVAIIEALRKGKNG
jgi:transcriptional regulator with XRE-family HTH domain